MNIHVQNNMCDSNRCRSNVGEVRVLPTGGGGNIIVCRACFDHEIGFRRERNKELSRETAFPLPRWQDLEVYGGAT